MDQETQPMTKEKSARRFLFETSFDTNPEVDEQSEQESELPPEPTFGQDELDAARREGRREGRDAGIAASLDTLEAAIAAHLESISSLLPRIEQAQAAAHEKLARDGVMLASTVTAKILPTLATRHGTEEIEALVADCLSRLVEEPKISVSVGPAAGAALAERLDEFVENSGFEGRFVVRTEAEMGPADCRLEWGDGTAARNLDAVWSEIDAAVSRFLAIEGVGAAVDNAGDDRLEDEAEAAPRTVADADTGAPDPMDAAAEANAETGPAAEPKISDPEIEPSA